VKYLPLTKEETMNIAAQRANLLLVSLIAGAFLITGCATGNPGKLGDPSITQQIQKQKTTKADISRMFGSPKQSSVDSNGVEIWTYSEPVKNYASVVTFGMAPTNVNVLIVKFKNNVVVDYEYSKNKALYGSFGKMK